MSSRTTLVGGAGTVGRAISQAASRSGSEIAAWEPRRGERPPAASTVVAAVPEASLPDVLSASIAAGLGAVAPAADARMVAQLRDRFDAPARDAGVTLVLCAGWDPVVVDLLATRAAVDLPVPVEAHVAYATPRVGWRGRSRGERLRLAAGLGRSFPVLDAGVEREEREAEARRLAWYPRPVGPRHAAGTSSSAVMTLPRHLPSLSTIRGYRATSTAAAEARQMVANAARWAPVRNAAAAVLTRDRSPSGDGAGLDWACVVELSDGDRVSRAWAHGEDHIELTAATLLLFAEAIAEGGAEPGVRAPSEVIDAGKMLDDLAARSRLRWGRAASGRVGG